MNRVMRVLKLMVIGALAMGLAGCTSAYLAVAGLAGAGYVTYVVVRGAKHAKEVERLGTPDALDPAQVKAIKIKTDAGICPGAAQAIPLIVTLADGSSKETWTDPANKVGHFDYAAFTLTASHGTFSNGLFTPSAELMAILNEGVKVKAGLASNPSIQDEQVVKAGFDCYQPISLEGRQGRDGQRGQEGSRGGTGGSGGTGGKGDDGPELVVDVGYMKTALFPKLLVVKVASGAQVAWYIKPAEEAQPVTLSSIGGRGGDGGQGGNGGMGEGAPPGGGQGGPGGGGGAGGAGGDGGRGGTITLRFDARHPELRQLVLGQSGGGPGGRRGPGGNPGRGGSGYPPASDGPRGPDGPAGIAGQGGEAGRYQAVPAQQLFSGDGVTLM